MGLPLMYFNIFIVLILLFLAGLLEYGTHRWLLHKRIGQQWFKYHTIEHHGYGLMQPEHTMYSWQTAFLTIILTSPVLILCYWSWYALLWIPILIWIKFAHEAVHRYIHNEPWKFRAYILCPWVNWSRQHHLRHHKCPNKCFGELFPWTDYLFFTN